MPLPVITCLNGAYLPAAEATIPISDRGFRFGDGVFETIRLVNGVPYQWDLHMARLSEGLAALRFTPAEIHWARHASEVIARNKSREGFLRLAVSRGVGSIGYLPEPRDQHVTWVIEYLPPAPAITHAASLHISRIARTPLASLPMNLKLAQGVGSTLALLEARDAGCDEALQLTTENMLCEAASANLFWVKSGQIFTPALSNGCLRGTTRAAVMRLASAPVCEITAPLDALREAEGIFLTNSRSGVWPVARVEALDWQCAETHPLIAILDDALIHDRDAYTAQHRAQWPLA
ncbi:MAG: aminotransferase class IV [Rickettsiales bacterium]